MSFHVEAYLQPGMVVERLESKKSYEMREAKDRKENEARRKKGLPMVWSPGPIRAEYPQLVAEDNALFRPRGTGKHSFNALYVLAELLTQRTSYRWDVQNAFKKRWRIVGDVYPANNAETAQAVFLDGIETPEAAQETCTILNSTLPE